MKKGSNTQKLPEIRLSAKPIRSADEQREELAKQGASARAKATTAAVESIDRRKAREISQQYGVLANKANAFIQEAIKFGAILIEWEQFLGKSQGRDGAGLKNWLELNCPEVKYSTAIKYKLLAEKNAQILGGGAMALAALQGESTVRQPDGEVIDVECKVIEKRDEIFSEANSFQKLEQMWLDLFGTGEKPKAKKVEKPLPKMSRKDEAKAIWNGVMVALSKSSVRDAIPLLGEKETRVCHDGLRDLVSLLKKHLEEF